MLKTELKPRDPAQFNGKYNKLDTTMCVLELFKNRVSRLHAIIIPMHGNKGSTKVVPFPPQCLRLLDSVPRLLLRFRFYAAEINRFCKPRFRVFVSRPHPRNGLS